MACDKPESQELPISDKSVAVCKHLTACGTPHIYDEHLGLMLSTVVRQILMQREDIIGKLSEILGMEIGQHLNVFRCVNRADVAMNIEKILVRKDRILEVRLIDGTEFNVEMDEWTPSNRRWTLNHYIVDDRKTLERLN
ncbi:hypothetical protein [Enterococcus hermanniensis]|uniref:hypothetical protein n=1 Tax=Enterococcus hermanniensis TaxID=249189 RepID=UPI001FE43D9B|nr:hypothetical protein [Enterococcus hermanniensis]